VQSRNLFFWHFKSHKITDIAGTDLISIEISLFKMAISFNTLRLQANILSKIGKKMIKV
jgi:hypothetical protein